jgi:hypothetical protein
MRETGEEITILRGSAPHARAANKTRNLNNHDNLHVDTHPPVLYDAGGNFWTEVE